MNTTDSKSHPAPEQWADYLYGELPPETRARLDDHVRACPDCQKQLGQWRETMGALDAWKLPRRTRPIQGLGGYARWAVAAALVLGLGWLGGRLSASRAPGVEQLRAELLPVLKQELRQELQAEWALALQTADERAKDRLVELAQAWAEARDQDQQTTLALYERTERQRQIDHAALRRDLETVAVVAQAAIGTTQDQLNQLAVNSLSPAGGGGGLLR